MNPQKRPMSSLFWFITVPLLHGILISYLLPNAGPIGLLLIFDVSIVCGYGARREIIGGPSVKQMMREFKVPSSYLGGLLMYFACVGYWSTESVFLRAWCLFMVFSGCVRYLQFPVAWLTVVHRGKV